MPFAQPRSARLLHREIALNPRVVIDGNQPVAQMVLWPMPKAVLFDLDGTLIDSVPDITEAVAELMRSEQLPPFSEAQVRRMVGRGVRALVRRAYDAQGIALDELSLDHRTDAMMEIYPRHLMGRTTLTPGVREAIAFFRSGGVPMAVVTNKPQSAAETILRHFRLTDAFAVVIGDTENGLPRKPQPDMLLSALARLYVHPRDAIMVGDSSIDIRAAKAGRIRAVALRCGYASEPLETFEPELMIEDLTEIAAIFAPA